jgi:proteic killer suppression protein
MILSYADKLTSDFAKQGNHKRLPPEIHKRAMMRLVQLDNAVVIDDLRIPPSNQLEALQGDRKGQYSIRINNQWRVCFYFENGQATQVQITDYH